MLRRNLDVIVALLIAIWSGLFVLSSATGIPLYFPFLIFSEDNLPVHRALALRTSIFATLLYFSLSHIFARDKKYRPVHFLRIYLNMMCLICLILYVRMPNSRDDLDAMIIILLLTVLANIASRKVVRSYFGNR